MLTEMALLRARGLREGLQVNRAAPGRRKVEVANFCDDAFLLLTDAQPGPDVDVHGFWIALLSLIGRSVYDFFFQD